jgi:hypothetical protein
MEENLAIKNFFFFFCKQTFIQTTKEPKALQTAKAIEGDGSFPLHMGVEGGGGGGGGGEISEMQSEKILVLAQNAT